MVVVLFGQHFAEYILTLAGGFPADEKVVLFISKNNVRDEIPSSFKATNKDVQTILSLMPGPGKPLVFLKSVLKFRRMMREVKPDIVHFQEIPKGFSFVCWLFARRALRVLTVHDVVSHPGGDSKTTERQEFIRNHMRKSADMLIVHGQKLLETMQEVHPELASKTRVIPHPAFRISKVARGQNVIPNQLLFFGRIAEYKGLKYLVEACRLLQERGKSFKLVIAGQGEDFQPNEAGLKLIRDVSIINRRILPDEIDDLFASSDIIVLPYIEASQSGVIAYALGFGKPSVASRIGSIPDMIRDQYNGLLTVPADAYSLAAALEELIDNSALKQKFAANAAILGNTTYSPELVAGATLEAYKQILNQVRK